MTFQKARRPLPCHWAHHLPLKDDVPPRLLWQRSNDCRYSRPLGKMLATGRTDFAMMDVSHDSPAQERCGVASPGASRQMRAGAPILELQEHHLAEHLAPDEFEYSIAATPPTRLQKRWAFGVIGTLLLVFTALVPFASIQLARENGFIPAVQAIIFVADLATAVLLFNHFAILRAREFLILADSYLFSALINIPYRS